MGTPKIQMYTSGWCSYCSRARRLLQSKGVAFEEIDVDARRETRAEMVARAGRTSVPQIFIGDVHVGGYDELRELDTAGALDPLINPRNPS